ncbi:MAG: hypothetical protein IJQ88_10995, partial [Clostridia bacterium]|nr:hypothetical protein [Clostridia bacterium]
AQDHRQRQDQCKQFFHRSGYLRPRYECDKRQYMPESSQASACNYSLFPLFSQDEIQGQLTGQDLPANRQWTVGIISAGTTVNLSFLYDYPVRGKINGKRTIRI